MTALKRKQKLRHATALAGLLGSLALAGCSSQGGVGDLLDTRPVAEAKPAKPAAPAINMGGRWTLSSPSGGLCGMTFTTRGSGFEGGIAPEGGCPGQFFTSRSWALERAGLVIKDHKGKTLARLASSAPGSFQGNSTSGIPVTLTR
jgi:hypothetical protein